MPDEVGGDDQVLGVLDDALERTVGGLLDGSLDVVVTRRLLEANDEINNGDVERGNTEGETTMSRIPMSLQKSKGRYKLTYVSLPLSEGMTLPTALAAPVEDGMMLLLTLRPPRQSLFEGPSTVFWVAVVAWMVLMRPSTMPNLSWMTLARGARQLVVQEALEIYRR